MKLILVRHGESEGNVRGTLTGADHHVLTAKGRSDSRALGERLRRRGTVDLVLCSSAVRALETAKGAGFPDPVVVPDLRETNGGVWSERTRVEFEAEFPDFSANFDPDAPYPSGESHDQMAKRVVAALRAQSIEKHGSVLVFTHLGPINAVIHELLSLPLSRFPMFDLPNCGFVTLDVERTGLKRLILN